MAFPTWMEAAGQFGGGSQAPASSGGAFGGGQFGGGQFGGTGVSGGLLSGELERQGGLFTGRGVIGQQTPQGAVGTSLFQESLGEAAGAGTTQGIKGAFGELSSGLLGNLATSGLAQSSLLGVGQRQIGTAQESALQALASQEPAPGGEEPTAPAPPQSAFGVDVPPAPPG